MNIFNKSNPNRIFYILFTVILALCITCLTGLLILNSVKAQNPNTNDTTENKTPVNSGLYDSVILKETPDAGLSYQNKIIFVGDSTTYHLKPSGSLADGINTKQVWAPTSGTLTLDSDILQKTIFFPLTSTEKTIPEALEIVKPEIMVITLGLNGSGGAEKDDFSRNYKKLINKIKEVSPNTKIILQSVFPITAEHSSDDNTFTNEKIDIINGWIVEIASDTNCKYLNTASVLKDNNGALISEYNTEYHSDGVHIWKKGYAVMLNYIRTHAYLD